MGAIYQPKYQDRHGVTQVSTVWWVRFRQHGKTVRQSTETTSEAKTKAFLREREGKVALRERWARAATSRPRPGPGGTPSCSRTSRGR